MIPSSNEKIIIIQPGPLFVYIIKKIYHISFSRNSSSNMNNFSSTTVVIVVVVVVVNL